MEIGYAYALSRPILLVVTDFLVYRLKQKPSCQFYYDPVLTRMTGRLVRNCDLPPGDDFEQRLLTAISCVHEQVTREVVDLIRHPEMYTSPPVAPPTEDTGYPKVLIEFGGGLFEWQRTLARRLRESLKRESGCSVAITQRYAGTSDSAYEAGEKDIAQSLSADLLVVCADSEEMNAGSAALLGLARALGKTVILYDSKATLSFVEGGQEMSRNLMIDCAVDASVSRLEDVPGAVTRFLHCGHCLQQSSVT